MRKSAVETRHLPPPLPGAPPAAGHPRLLGRVHGDLGFRCRAAPRLGGGRAACRMPFTFFRKITYLSARRPVGQSKSDQNQPKSPKVNMLKFGDVSFDLGFERGRMSATGYVAKISMLRLNIGSGKLSSCMLSIGRGPKAVQGKGGAAPPCLVRIWVRGQC